MLTWSASLCLLSVIIFSCLFFLSLGYSFGEDNQKRKDYKKIRELEKKLDWYRYHFHK